MLLDYVLFHGYLFTTTSYSVSLRFQASTAASNAAAPPNRKKYPARSVVSSVLGMPAAELPFTAVPFCAGVFFTILAFGVVGCTGLFVCAECVGFFGCFGVVL